MMTNTSVQVSVYINEGDEWQPRPLYLEILKMLRLEGLSGGTVIRGVAGFTRGTAVHSDSLVDVGGKLPLVVQFIDNRDEIERIMPLLREMAKTRLITLQELQIVPQPGPVDAEKRE